MTTVTRKEAIVEIECDTAADLVAILNPVNGLFLQAPHEPVYAFRGASSVAHELLPAAYRPSSWLFHQKRWIHPPLTTVADQGRAEFETLQLFFQTAAHHGIRLPEDSQTLRNALDAWMDSWDGSEQEPIKWPPGEFWSLIALAQHYGVATRALDFTWDPLIAAYFAARFVVEPYDETRKLAVWAVSYIAQTLDRILHRLQPAPRPLRFFEAPGADNDNLRAQRGLFLIETHTISSHTERFVPQAYDSLLPPSLPGYDRDWFPSLPLVMRVLVPAVEAPRVLLYASASNITGGSLFPGLWGIAREMEEKRLTADLTFETPAGAREIQKKIRTVLSGRLTPR